MWIKCIDLFPEAQVKVLFFSIRKGIRLGWKIDPHPDTTGWEDLTDRDTDGYYDDVYDVTHWMPLPEPPKEDQ